jgi:hypothetical protein
MDNTPDGGDAALRIPSIIVRAAIMKSRIRVLIFSSRVRNAAIASFLHLR